MGEMIIIAAIAVLAFFSGRSTLRNIKAELRGEGTCAGCSGCGKNGGECRVCMQKMEELRKLKESKRDVRTVEG